MKVNPIHSSSSNYVNQMDSKMQLTGGGGGGGKSADTRFRGFQKALIGQGGK